MELGRKQMQDVLPPSPISPMERSIRNITLKKESRRTEVPLSFGNRGQFGQPPREPYHGESHQEEEPRRPRYMLWGVGVVVFSIFLFFLFCMLWSGAKVVVMPKAIEVSVNGTFMAKKIADATSMPFELMTIVRETTKNVPAQGTETVSVPATGQIIVYNDYSGAVQKLITNTRFETPGGFIYRIHGAISIPGQTKAGGKTTPGSVEVTVYADQPGEKYNIGLTDFTIPGFKNDSARYQKFYARSKTPMSGGFSGTRPKILDSDISAARAAMETELSAGLKADAEGQIPDGYILYPEGQFISFELLPSTTADGSSSATLKERGTLYGALFAKDTLAQFVVAAGHAVVYEGVPVTLSVPEKLLFSVVNRNNAKPWNDGQFAFTLNGSAKAIWGFDKNQFKDDLAGKTKAALQTILSGYPGIDSATVSIRPFWKNVFPDNPQKINVEVTPAQ